MPPRGGGRVGRGAGGAGAVRGGGAAGCDGAYADAGAREGGGGGRRGGGGGSVGECAARLPAAVMEGDVIDCRGVTAAGSGAARMCAFAMHPRRR